MMQFEDYLHEEIVKVVKKDQQRAYSLISEAERKLSSLNERIEKIGVRDDNANDYVEQCYDILLFLIRAKLFIEGYSCSGQGAHEAEISYMIKLGFDEKEIKFTDKLRYFRNGILYYGKLLDDELLKMKELADREGLVSALIKDAGKTQLDPGTITCLGIGPDKEEKINR